MQLTQKPKSFISTFFVFPAANFNFECFEKKNDPHSLRISEIIDSEKCCYLTILTWENLCFTEKFIEIQG